MTDPAPRTPAGAILLGTFPTTSPLARLGTPRTSSSWPATHSASSPPSPSSPPNRPCTIWCQDTPQRLPAQSRASRSPQRPSLRALAGPLCPCLPASTPSCSSRRSSSTTPRCTLSTRAGPAAPTAWASGWTLWQRVPSSTASSPERSCSPSSPLLTSTSSCRRPRPSRGLTPRCSTPRKRGRTRKSTRRRVPSFPRCTAQTSPSMSRIPSWWTCPATAPEARLFSRAWLFVLGAWRLVIQSLAFRWCQ
mmetsp:Transcript_26553/g.51738  ORF Transcript_26553/g.51738 Transcript_26553/m.51738 type:complete len:249 (+) Transcript_26553:1163-1909(+)